MVLHQKGSLENNLNNKNDTTLFKCCNYLILLFTIDPDVLWMDR